MNYESAVHNEKNFLNFYPCFIFVCLLIRAEVFAPAGKENQESQKPAERLLCR